MMHKVAWLASWLAACVAVVPALGDPAVSPRELDLVQAQQTLQASVIQQAGRAVIVIYGATRAGNGSGVLIDPSGLALTNFHVVRDAGEEGQAGLPDGKLYPWRLIGIDPGGDLALIQLQGRDDFPIAVWGDSRAVRVGDPVLAMGSPFNLSEDFHPTVTAGIVSGVDRFQPGEGGSNLLVYGQCLQIDSSINPGNSGGPLFDQHGRLIGINGRASFAERGRVNVGLGYAISLQQVRHFLADLRAGKTAQHVTLRAQMEDQQGAVRAQRIEADSRLAKAGMKEGDRLLSLDGQTIDSVNQLLSLLTIYPADWPVPIAWEHEGKTVQTVLRLEAQTYPDPARPPTRNPRVIPATQPTTQPATQPATQPTTQPATRPATTRPAPLPLPPLKQKVQVKPLPYGQIRDARINAQQARKILSAGKISTGTSPQLAQQLHAWKNALAQDQLKEVVLEGGDLIGGRRAYRLTIQDQDEKRYRAWFTVFGPDGQMQSAILQAQPLDAPAVEPQYQSVAAPVLEPSASADVIDQIQRRCVTILGPRTTTEQGYAAGIIVSPDGQILTAMGVYLLGPNVKVMMHDGSTHVARVIRRSEALETALLKIDPSTPDYFELPKTPAVEPMDYVWAVANPFKVAQGREALSVNMGVIAMRAKLDARRKMQEVSIESDLLLLDAITSNPGSPGGALAGLDGRLAGMIGRVIESKSTGTRLNYAIPGDVLYAWLHGSTGSTLAAAPATATQPAVSTLNTDPAADPAAALGIRLFTLAGRRAPAYIDQIAPDSPAQKADLRKDDLILSVNGKVVRSLRECQEILSGLPANQPLTLVVKRLDQVLTVRLPPREGRAD